MYRQISEFNIRMIFFHILNIFLNVLYATTKAFPLHDYIIHKYFYAFLKHILENA